MILLLIFAFLAGLVTILSPCILPVLPIILSTSVGGERAGRAYPIGVVSGFVISFTFFTLFLSTIVRISGISPDLLRYIAVVIIAGFGFSLLIPRFQSFFEYAFSFLSHFAPRTNNKAGYGGGVAVGLSLGLLWTPCVGPILASVISLAITGSVTLDTFFITFAYAMGAAIPMFAIMIGGSNLLHRIPWLLAHTTHIQKAFGIIMIITALGIFLNWDRRVQTYVLQTFPQYGTGLTTFENIAPVQKQLERVNGKNTEQTNSGKPLFDLQPKGVKAPELIPGGVWLNSAPLTLTQLKGKVVVIDFWTYSCINCQRTLPYLRQWYEKYKDSGLVIIGVHSPEFEFEKNEKNLAKAVADFGLLYPIVQDNNFSTWKAYRNNYWPAKYVIDKEGNIRYTHFGEGGYDESERVIQALLKETGATNVPTSLNNPQYQTYAKTPETYLGYARIDRFASQERIIPDKVFLYSVASPMENNEVAFVGNWEVTREYAAPQKGAKLFMTFESKEVYLVMKPTGTSAKVKVFVDGVAQYFGKDAMGGVVTVDADRLYTLITLPSPGKHTLQLEFEDGEVQLFAFTFG
ncbi:MAG: cytochrome c biogenesis protein DipZ [Candidatus Pacebacteria bacterium]|nr:cytochrome c biogenesis protein DipZ [Candidatus Paceibacterota bacterium]